MNSKLFSSPWSKRHALQDFADEVHLNYLDGGIVGGETLAICGQARSGRTAVALWIAGDFIRVHKKRVMIISGAEDRVRWGVGLAVAGVPITGADSSVVPANAGPDWLEVVPPWDVFNAEKIDNSIGAVIADYFPEDLGNLALTLRHKAQERDVPIFFTVQLARQVHGEAEVIRSTSIEGLVDHALLLNPTLDRRFIVMELTQARRGKPGFILLDAKTFKEVL